MGIVDSKVKAQRFEEDFLGLQNCRLTVFNFLNVRVEWGIQLCTTNVTNFAVLWNLSDVPSVNLGLTDAGNVA